ncbi:Mitochondrial import inner membrane translocase subunit Tim17-A [Dirofilaria immitis]|nr:Mitochondrial import inner membrane translocase subunit Tim17-A [Dirofilaria immitis]
MDDREPWQVFTYNFPYRIGDDVGGAFSLGLAGGSIFHAHSGFRNSPWGHKFVGIVREVRTRSPVVGGQFAAWGGLFSAIDCSLVAIRKKEDMLNPVVSGGLTGALLAVRSGPMVMMGSAAVGAVIVGMIEVASLAVGKFAGMVLDPNTMQQNELEDPAILSTKQQQKHGSAGNSSASSVSGDASSVPFSLAQPY